MKSGGQFWPQIHHWTQLFSPCLIFSWYCNAQVFIFCIPFLSIYS